MPLVCDLLVVGSGAGGLSAAVTAAALGLKVIVVEKEAQFGGTTAWSGGWMWIPRNPLAREAAIDEDPAAPLAYLRHELGAHFDEAKVQAFLAAGPAMIDFFRQRTRVQFIDGNRMPDFHGQTPGAATGGRSVCAAPFDGRELGPHLHQLKPPLDLTTLWGMGIASGADLRHFFQSQRSLKSFAYVTKRVLRHLTDVALHGRGLHLVNGNALVARLAQSAFDLGVELLLASPVLRLTATAGTVTGAVIDGPRGPVEVHARRGVVLACGGFPRDPRRLGELLPNGGEHWSAAPPGNTGDGLRLGEAAGGAIACDLAQPMAWAPVSLVPRADGGAGHFPHLVERGKPGLIAVTAQGRRFANEADSYYDFMLGLMRALPPGAPAEAWLVCDRRFLRRWGLGAVKPAPMPIGAHLRSGYLKSGRTLDELARACGIDPAGFTATVADYNRHARDGRDPTFARGSTPYNRAGGDPEQAPNPCVAPIGTGPYYAVKVVAGSLGSFAGLRTDAHARVLDAASQPVAGLYASGNDAASVMGGRYPSGGITLGPAMTFGWLAAHHAAGIAPPLDEPRSTRTASETSPA